MTTIYPNELMAEREQLAQNFDNFTEIKAQVRQLIDENSQLKAKITFYDMDRDDGQRLIKALFYDKMALHVVIGAIGQAVIDGRLKGVGSWFRELRKLAE